jgi:hypothetical protein
MNATTTNATGTSDATATETTGEEGESQQEIVEEAVGGAISSRVAVGGCGRPYMETQNTLFSSLLLSSTHNGRFNYREELESVERARDIGYCCGGGIFE